MGDDDLSCYAYICLSLPVAVAVAPKAFIRHWIIQQRPRQSFPSVSPSSVSLSFSFLPF